MDERMIDECGIGNSVEGSVVAYFKVLSRHSPGGSVGNHETFHS
jgi:hypothetical protein